MRSSPARARRCSRPCSQTFDNNDPTKPTKWVATNHIAFGRDWAGRSNAYLVDNANEYSSATAGLFDGWLLEKFDGSVVCIIAAGVEELLAVPP